MLLYTLTLRPCLDFINQPKILQNTWVDAKSPCLKHIQKLRKKSPIEKKFFYLKKDSSLTLHTGRRSFFWW